MTSYPTWKRPIIENLTAGFVDVLRTDPAKAQEAEARFREELARHLREELGTGRMSEADIDAMVADAMRVA